MVASIIVVAADRRRSLVWRGLGAQPGRRHVRERATTLLANHSVGRGDASDSSNRDLREGCSLAHQFSRVDSVTPGTCGGAATYDSYRFLQYDRRRPAGIW